MIGKKIHYKYFTKHLKKNGSYNPTVELYQWDLVNENKWNSPEIMDKNGKPVSRDTIDGKDDLLWDVPKDWMVICVQTYTSDFSAFVSW